MKSWLYPGARIVCVDDTFLSISGRENVPRIGGIYTVRAIVPAPSGWPPDSLEVLLCEIVNRTVRWRDGVSECGFWDARFAPTINTDDQVEAMRRLMQKARDDARQGLAVEYR